MQERNNREKPIDTSTLILIFAVASIAFASSLSDDAVSGAEKTSTYEMIDPTIAAIEIEMLPTQTPEADKSYAPLPLLFPNFSKPTSTGVAINGEE